jgi:hypothetical protein
MIADAFATFKSRLELNRSFDAKIQARHNAVRSVIANIETHVETKLIGSLARKTRIQPLPSEVFDVDILVIRGTFDRWVSSGGLTSDQAISGFLEKVHRSERYAAKNPAPDKPAISIPYEDDTKVELVPAYRDNIGHHSNGGIYTPKGRAYWVPKSNGWELADYDYDAKYVSDTNAACDGWLIPTIKMLKALKRQLFPDVPSFFFEMLVTKIIGEITVPAYKNAGAALSYPTLIHSFFTHGGGWLDFSLCFPGSLTKSVTIDPGVAQRGKETFETINKYLALIENTSSDTEKQRLWRGLFGDPFPAI